MAINDVAGGRMYHVGDILCKFLVIILCPVFVQQVSQLLQTNRTATWAITGKNRPIGLSAKSVHLTSLYGAKDISKC